MKTTGIQNGVGQEVKTNGMKYCVITLLLFLMHGNIKAQEEITVSLGDFTRLSISNSSQVKLVPGTANSITFTGTQEDAERIKDAIEEDELELRGKTLDKIRITFKQLEEIEIKGNGTATCMDPIQADKFKIDISGAGDVTLTLNAKKVKVDISGAGNLTLKGEAEALDMDISGAGNVNAENFRVKKCNADISGNGQCTVDVTDELITHISGSGSVSYKNPPAKIHKDISGIGKVSDENSSGSGGDTTRFKLGDRHVWIFGGRGKGKKSGSEKVQPHWAGVEIGFNGYMTPQNKMFPAGYDFLELNQAKSVGVNLNFFDYSVKLYKRYIMFVSGLGISYNNYRFKGDSLLVNGPDGIYARRDSINYDKNKLTVSYVNVPLLLEFNTNKYEKKSFHVSIGGIVGYRLGSHTKQVYHKDGDRVRPKTYNQFSINPWRVDATARLGYRNVGLFANYDLVALFRDKKGPVLHPFTIGITLVGW